MQIIHYADDTYATGDDIAYAVIAYARALAVNASSATAGIPFRREDGTVGHLELLLGPASQIVLESIDDTEGQEDELRDEELVAQLKRDILNLTEEEPPSAISAAEQGDLRMPDFDDM